MASIDQASTSSSSSESKRPKAFWYKLGFGIAVAVLLLSFLLQGGASITKPIVEAELAKIAENIAAQASISGDEASFTYEDVEIKGGLLGSTVTIKNPKLYYAAATSLGSAQITTVTTARAVADAGDLKNQALEVVFPDPFSVVREGFAPLEVTFPKSPVYAYARDGSAESHDVRLPESLTIATFNQGEDPITIRASFDSHPTLKRVIDTKASTSQTEAKFSNMRITSTEDERTMQWKLIHGVSSEAPFGVNARRFNSRFSLEEFSLSAKQGALGPYGVALDVTGTYLTPEKNMEKHHSVSDLELTINKADFVHKDYQLTFAGNASVKPDDSMPFGTVNVGVKGLDKFRNSEFLSAVDAGLKNKIIEAITGNTDAGLQEAFVTLKREKGGTLFIGQSSFENLVGMVITHGLSSKLKESQENKKAEGANAPTPEVGQQSAPLPAVDGHEQVAPSAPVGASE